jgi:UDP:flavonoid glycosyltransferase YjiC (YdhE family)
MNAVRHAYGFPPLENDIRAVYTDGDLVLYPDVPELIEVSPRPAHHHFIGPCQWEPAGLRPAWWDRAMASTRPCVFVSLGSSGALGVLPAVLEALSALPVTVLLATSGRPVGTIDPNVFAADLLPYGEAAAHCALVISQGGMGGIYATLAAGTPMLAIPSNVDMQLSAALLDSSGAGLVVRSERATRDRIAAAVTRMWSTPGFKIRATAWAGVMREYRSGELFTEVLDRMVPDPIRAQR